MRAILIDPVEQTVTEVQCSGQIHDKDGLPGIYTLTHCNLITAMSLPAPGEVLYLDDEGLLKMNHFFYLYGHTQPFGGKGLILGTDADGDCIATDFKLNRFSEFVRFAGGPMDMSHHATERNRSGNALD